MHFVLLLVFVFYLPFLGFEVEDSPSLGMVEGSRSVKCTQEERRENYPSHRLKAQSPANGAKKLTIEYHVVSNLMISKAQKKNTIANVSLLLKDRKILHWDQAN